MTVPRASITHCRRLRLRRRSRQRRSWKRDVRRCTRDFRDRDPCAQCLCLEVCICHGVVRPVARGRVGRGSDGIGAGGLREGVGVAFLAGAAADLTIVAAGVGAAAGERVGGDI